MANQRPELAPTAFSPFHVVEVASHTVIIQRTSNLVENISHSRVAKVASPRTTSNLESPHASHHHSLILRLPARFHSCTFASHVSTFETRRKVGVELGLVRQHACQFLRLVHGASRYGILSCLAPHYSFEAARLRHFQNCGQTETSVGWTQILYMVVWI